MALLQTLLLLRVNWGQRLQIPPRVINHTLKLNTAPLNETATNTHTQTDIYCESVSSSQDLTKTPWERNIRGPSLNSKFIFLLQTKALMHTYTHKMTGTNQICWKTNTAKINKIRSVQKQIKLVAFTHRTAKNLTFLKLQPSVSASIVFELCWPCLCVHVWVCVCQNDTWLSWDTLRSVWNVGEDFWKAVLKQKSLLNSEAPPWFLRWLAPRWQAAGSEVERCWQWTEVAEWTTGVLLVRRCSLLFSVRTDWWPLSHLDWQRKCLDLPVLRTGSTFI